MDDSSNDMDVNASNYDSILYLGADSSVSSLYNSNSYSISHVCITYNLSICVITFCYCKD